MPEVHAYRLDGSGARQTNRLCGRHSRLTKVAKLISGEPQQRGAHTLIADLAATVVGVVCTGRSRWHAPRSSNFWGGGMRPQQDEKERDELSSTFNV
jgi:hypothetical protein